SIYFLDNLDPLALKEILEKIDNIEKTLVVPISKSGTTQETQLLALTLKELFLNSWKENFLWLSDTSAFEKLNNLGWKEVAKVPIQFDGLTDIGGRFSSPHTLIFFLPLFILLKKDFRKLEKLYNLYVSFQSQIRVSAFALAKKFQDKDYAYFYPVVKGNFGENFTSWFVQLFQESLGSKRDGFSVKTIPYFEDYKNSLFSPLEFDLEIKDPMVLLMSQMYFFQLFVAFFSAFKNINFVTQDYVENYKEKARNLELENKDEFDIEAVNLDKVLKELKNRINETHKFIEVVLYFYPKKGEIDKIKRIFKDNFKDKICLVFVGSDWNHHSYQAAFKDKETFYVFLTSSYYIEDVAKINPSVLKRNISTLKTIAKATFLTLKDKSLIFSLCRE
ncbi:MAG: hypothetical protein QXZ20_03150, partial [Candidatus Aenigmatarchaeota archaeon]